MSTETDIAPKDPPADTAVQNESPQPVGLRPLMSHTERPECRAMAERMAWMHTDYAQTHLPSDNYHHLVALLMEFMRKHQHTAPPL